MEEAAFQEFMVKSLSPPAPRWMASATKGGTSTIQRSPLAEVAGVGMGLALLYSVAR